MGIKHAASLGGPSVQVDVTFSFYLEIQEIAQNVPEAEVYLQHIPFQVAVNHLVELTRITSLGIFSCL